MLVDRVSLTYILDYSNVLVGNYETIRRMVAEFVKKRYNDEYNYGVEYYYEYKVMHLQDCMNELERRIIIALMIYKDIKLAELEMEVEERLESGL